MTSSVSTQSRPTDRLSSYTRRFVTASLGNKVASCRQVGVTKTHARVTQTCGIQLSYETEIIARMWRSVSMVRGRAVCYISCRNWRTDALRTRKQVRCYKSPEMKRRTYTRTHAHTHQFCIHRRRHRVLDRDFFTSNESTEAPTRVATI